MSVSLHPAAICLGGICAMLHSCPMAYRLRFNGTNLGLVNIRFSTFCFSGLKKSQIVPHGTIWSGSGTIWLLGLLVGGNDVKFGIQIWSDWSQMEQIWDF